jgi:hypothetical protein
MDFPKWLEPVSKLLEMLFHHPEEKPIKDDHSNRASVSGVTGDVLINQVQVAVPTKGSYWKLAVFVILVFMYFGFLLNNEPEKVTAPSKEPPPATNPPPSKPHPPKPEGPNLGQMSSVSLGSLLKGKADQLDKLRTDWWEDDAVYDKQLSGLHDKDMNVPHDDKKIAEVRAKRKELEKEFSKQAVETVHDTVPMLEEAIRRMSYAANSKDYTECSAPR